MTTHQTHLSHPKYRPDIDGLRAIAVLAVVGFHAFPNWIRGGFIGVDVFFVISGYLISTIIFENLDSGTFSFSEFYARRINRIFPALLLVLTACFAFGWFALLADEFKQLGKHIAAGAGFMSNFMLWSEAGYFDNSAETKPLLHLWSLGIEEQFYIVWPFVLWLAWKRKFNLITLVILVSVVSFYLNLKGIKKDAVATFYSPQTRFWELLIGSILAFSALYKKNSFSYYKLTIDVWLSKLVYRAPVEADGKTLSNVISFVGSLFLIFGFWHITKEVSFPGKWAVIPVVGAVLIILAGPKAWINCKVLSNKIVVWFGLISFPLYLWHWPLLSFTRIVEGETPSRYMRIAAIILAIALAWLTYKFVERPIRLGVSSKVKVTVLVILMFVIGYVGYNAYVRDGLKFRQVVKFYDSVMMTAKSSPKRSECHLPQKIESLTKKPCEYFFPNSSVAVLGNSHAVELAYSLAKELSSYEMGIVHFTMSGCPHNFRYKNNTRPTDKESICFDWHANVVSQIVISKTIETVVISYRNEDYLKDQHYRASLVNMIEEFLKHKKSVYLILQAPMPEGPIIDSLRNKLQFLKNFNIDSSINNVSVIGTKRSTWIETYTYVNELLKQVPSSVRIIDPSEFFCDHTWCYAVKDGKSLFFDGDHMSVEGARYVAKAIVERLHPEK